MYCQKSNSGITNIASVHVTGHMKNSISTSLILSKYCIKSINTNVNDIKLQTWKHFVDDCADI